MTPSQKSKVGRPCKGTSVARDNKANQDPIDIDVGKENKRKRQSMLLFPMVEIEIDTLK